MEYFIIPLTALIASILTFFSGFGLGTILLPAFILFFPPEISILLTALVHFLNNIFKLGLIGGHIHKKTLLLFGVPALITAYFGAKTLIYLPTDSTLGSFKLLGLDINLTPLNLIVGSMMIGFSLLELLPALKKIQFSNKWLVPGGILSGYFGGLSGHQGALRSAFLVKSGLSKEAYVSTGVGIACFVDLTRITVYFMDGKVMTEGINFTLLASAVVAAFVGAIIGKKLLKKITIGFIQNLVGIIMIVLGIGLILGFFTK